MTNGTTLTKKRSDGVRRGRSVIRSHTQEPTLAVLFLTIYICTSTDTDSPVRGNAPSHLQITAELSRNAAVQLQHLFDFTIIGHLPMD